MISRGFESDQRIDLRRRAESLRRRANRAGARAVLSSLRTVAASIADAPEDRLPALARALRDLEERL